MGQEEIIELLEKEKKELSSKEIANKLNANQYSIHKAIRILLKNKEIRYKTLKIKEALENYNRKGIMKVYFMPTKTKKR